jgi:hypothetical protein
LKIIELPNGNYIPINLIRTIVIDIDASRDMYHSYIRVGQDIYPFFDVPGEYFLGEETVSRITSMRDVITIHEIAINIFRTYPKDIIRSCDWMKIAWMSFTAGKE